MNTVPHVVVLGRQVEAAPVLLVHHAGPGPRGQQLLQDPAVSRAGRGEQRGPDQSGESINTIDQSEASTHLPSLSRLSIPAP